MPMGYVVSANPTAAMLEKLFVGQRSGVRPFAGFVSSQNQLNVRCSSVSRNADCRALSWVGASGPVMLPFRAVVHATHRKKEAKTALGKSERVSRIGFTLGG